MIVTQKKEFSPITIIFETEDEARALRDFFGQTNREKRQSISNITDQQDDILVAIMWNQLDALLGSPKY